MEENFCMELDMPEATLNAKLRHYATMLRETKNLNPVSLKTYPWLPPFSNYAVYLEDDILTPPFGLLHPF